MDWNSESHPAISFVDKVTPCVGVWIETRPADNSGKLAPGHTLRGCVDWNLRGYIYALGGKVTPCVGVWIETVNQLYRQRD